MKYYSNFFSLLLLNIFEAEDYCSIWCGLNNFEIKRITNFVRFFFNFMERPDIIIHRLNFPPEMKSARM